MIEPGGTRKDSVLSAPKIKRNLNKFGKQRNCIGLLLDEDKIVVNDAEISIQ